MNLGLVRIATCVAILSAACPALIANSQDSSGTAAIVIEIRDPTGGRIPGAQIKIVLAPFGLIATQTTDSTGTVSVQLSSGGYDVSVASPGFRTTKKHIDVQQGADRTIEVVLDVATYSDPIVVETIPTERASLGDLIVPCSQRDLSAALAPTDPVYEDAAKLTRKLDSHGFAVRCTLASKKRRVFVGQMGAAFYRTSAGDFEALFLPQSETFDGLDIVEQQNQGRYLFSFRGSPRSKGHIDGSKPSYFIKKRNILFYVWDDEQLAETLRSKLND